MKQFSTLFKQRMAILSEDLVPLFFFSIFIKMSDFLCFKFLFYFKFLFIIYFCKVQIKLGTYQLSNFFLHISDFIYFTINKNFAYSITLIKH